MSENPLIRLHQLGQSIWLDSISRPLLSTGQLRRLIESDALSGVTSNPAIFEKAIGETSDYDDDIRRLHDQTKSPAAIYRDLAIADIQHAADLLRPVWDRTSGEDGYVSLEVSPHLARSTQPTIEEAKSLWHIVERPNVMIKIPGTKEGLAAIRESLAAGINVNVTLLFSVDRYREVADAWLTGLEQRARRKQDLHTLRSVASFFLSRIDVLLDPLLDSIAKGERRDTDDESHLERSRLAAELRGSVAIASAKLAYEAYSEIVASERFKKLEKSGARRQWLLWASTGTKSAEYSDVKYVEPLIGPETINTMPIETLDAYRDHGNPSSRLDKGVDKAHQVMRSLRDLDLDLSELTDRLENEGIEKFVKPFDKLMANIEQKSSLVTH